MAITWLDGRKIAALQEEQTRLATAAFTETAQRMPQLAVILVGNHPSSLVYVRNKAKKAKQLGIDAQVMALPSDSSFASVQKCLAHCSASPTIDAILLQLPLPQPLSALPLLASIAPEKDADGLHPSNLGQLLAGSFAPQPCTPRGVMALLAATKVNLVGKTAVMIGRSVLVGRPLALLLAAAGATVTVCHSATIDLIKHVQASEIVISATGSVGLINASMVRKGAILIDVGITLQAGKICGDVNPQGMEDQQVILTPVPGGVGPMTIAMLMDNTVWLARQRWRQQSVLS